MSFKRAAAIALCFLTRAAPCQQIPDRIERTPAPEIEEARRLRMDAGQAALAANAHDEAAAHFAGALFWDPFAPAVLGRLLDAAGEAAGARALWAHRIASAIADDRGALEADTRLKAAVAADPAIPRIAAARADAAAHLVATLKDARRNDGPIVALWAAGVAHDLLAGSPALRKRYAPLVNQALVRDLFDYKPVLAALKAVMDKALGEQRPETAIRAARCLLGLASQARFDDLEGPRPPALEPVAMAARAGLARAREQLEARRKGAAATVDELEALTAEEREAFTRAHATPGNPGVVVSPNGLYRIETTCGFGTLLGVAKTVELHHTRLAGHFGRDPFDGQQGLVRVVPESAGLESEGTPHWWAGGFQSGHVTTLKFSCGTIGGLGHGLTHELTHRFDAALNPGIPSWLVEGRAVWTGAAFGPPSDAGFVANHASFGTVEAAFIDGYGDVEKLTKLVESKIEDYRDNYTAGYALYLYLATWKEGGVPLYAERLQRFQRGCKEKGGNSLSWFRSCFCDGKGGRPKDLEAFAHGFGAFVKGFYWQSRAPWTSAYTHKVPDAGDDPHVYDAPTWHDSRERAEPWFGQDHARDAGEILVEAGRPRDAAAAYVWSLLVDEWRPHVVEELGGLLESDNRRVAAWALRSEAARRFGRAASARPPPELGAVTTKVTALTALMAASARASGDRPLVAAALAADHDRLAARFSIDPISRPPVPLPRKAVDHLDGPARMLGLFGWAEDELTHHEERRVENLWYEVPEGDLHVGRFEPREGTGTMDRAAHQRDVFVRTREWFAAGRYEISARIQCTTSFTSGAVVVGWTRKDRNVRMTFSGGDFLYSIGAKDDKTEFDAIDARLRGLRERDDPLWGASPGRRIRFDPPTNTFSLRVLVDGPEVRAYVNDELIGAYRTIDGHAVEGHVGFAAGQGAYLVGAPSVRRRDRSKAAGCDDSWPRGLDLGFPGTQGRAGIMNAAATGIPVTAFGAVVLWIPELGSRETPAAEGDYVAVAPLLASGVDEALAERGHPPSFVVCLPDAVPPAARDAIAADLKRRAPRASAVLAHRHAAPLTIRHDADGTAHPTGTILFLDPAAVVRVADRFELGESSLSHTMQRWLGVFEAIASGRSGTAGPKR